jgi:hypothetical protein
MTIAKLQSVAVSSTRASRFAQAAIGARDRLVPLPLAPPATPVLNKLCLPKERLAIMKPGLRQLRFSYEEGKLERPEGGETRTVNFTLVRNGVRRALLFVQDEIITFYARENMRALEEVRDLFQGNYDRLYFFHNSNPDATYRNVMEGLWSKIYHIRTKFIALSDLNAFERWAIQEQVDYLKRVLDVPEAPLQRPAANRDMPIGDFTKVARA